MSEALEQSDLREGYDEVQFGPRSLVVPSDWSTERFGDIFHRRRGSIDDLEDETIKYVGLKHLDSGQLTINGYDEDGRERSSSRVFHEGDVLFGKLRPNLNKAAIAPFSGICSSDIIPIYSEEDARQQYLPYLMHSEIVRNRVVSTMEGTNLPRTSWSDLEKTLIPLPPLTEQRHISEILSTVDKKIQKTDEIIDELNELEKGFVRNSISGEGLYSKDKLREEAIGPKSVKIPHHWEIKSISDLAEVKGGKRLPSGHDYADKKTDYPYIRVVDFVDGTISEEDIKYISEETREEIENYTISSEDVYISIAGHGLGISGTVPEKLNGANLTENAAKLTDLSGVLKDYLAMYLRSSFGQAEVQRFTVGSGQPKLALKRIKMMKVVVPPVNDQEHIKEIWNQIRYKKSIERNSQKELEQLKRGLMQDLLTGKVRVNTD